jgi:hypothetical protein
MRKALFLLAAMAAPPAASALGSCAGERCVQPPDWPAKLEFKMRLPDQGVEFQRFTVNSAGRILWISLPSRPTPVSLVEFRKILVAMDDGPDEPWLVLDAPPGADCATLRGVRAELDRLPLCRRGRCVEGKAWDRSDPPKGL